ncbi:uncharacterized protein N7482_009713 [Penicillium canariense]|uniref:DOPA-like domain-containing protein n=1 Tax=Penicillium canariense TaxID=189055 RepID=A0A9W9HRD6_9EURO|nr:uncharacterized protein N7482_009713 [Penicillium canariense]KAJ5153235.1 hypothetical protein N7482_009713 [Penicillium canariense]
MTDQFAFSHPSPLEGYENLEPLSEERNDDGKSFKNPQHGILSKAYEEFPAPLQKGPRGGFDIHIYHFQVSQDTLSESPDPTNTQQNNPDQVAYAKALWERIRRECTHAPLPNPTFISHSCPHPVPHDANPCLPPVPELRIYTFFDRPIGPHPVAMFEVNLFTPAQFGAFIPWLVINRGPLSALVHPNTDDDEEEERNHTQRAMWLGERIPLDLRIFKLMKEKQKREEEAAEKAKRETL